MNVRFNQDSIRFRLSAEELKDLTDQGHVLETMPYPAGDLKFSVQLERDLKEDLSLDGNTSETVLRVSRQALIRLSKATSKKDSFVSRLIPINRPVPVEVSLEVDAFTLKRT